MEQPEEYNTERELLDWLCYDLNKQRENIAKEFGIKPEEVEDIYLTINIGDNNNNYKINFYFDFINLLRVLFPNKVSHKYIF
ncbi:hypothetical protein Q5M86_02630, partial [Brachyspira innocens]|nr:hypothetical protein [Brachyspira innocens]